MNLETQVDEILDEIQTVLADMRYACEQIKGQRELGLPTNEVDEKTFKEIPEAMSEIKKIMSELNSLLS